MAVSLLQWQIDQRNVPPMQGALIQTLDQISPLFRYLPMDKIPGLHYEFERDSILGSVAWRALNGAYTESTGRTTPYREGTKILGGEAEVDVAELRAAENNGTRMLEKQVRLKLQAAANEWERAFLEGSELADGNEMVGLRSRIDGSQLILQASGGGQLTVAKVNALINAVPFSTGQGLGAGGTVKRGGLTTKLLIMNRDVYQKFSDLVYAQTGALRIEATRDDFGNPIEKYRDCQIVVVEQSGTGTSTLGFDEDPGDGTADTASMYCVALGDGLCHGFFNNGTYAQQGADGKPMPILMQVHKFGSVEELGTVESPRVKIRFEGSYGISLDHPRCAARLYGILTPA